MIDQGLIEEVEALTKKYEEFPTAMQGLGYKEVVSYLKKEITKEEMIEKIKMFNAWMIICSEHLAAIIRNKNLPNEKKEYFFCQMQDKKVWPCCKRNATGRTFPMPQTVVLLFTASSGLFKRMSLEVLNLYGVSHATAPHDPRRPRRQSCDSGLGNFQRSTPALPQGPFFARQPRQHGRNPALPTGYPFGVR